MYKKFLIELFEAIKVSDSDFQDAYKKMICSDSTGAKNCQDCLLAEENCIFSLFFVDTDSPSVRVKNIGEKNLFMIVEDGKAMEYFPYHIYGIGSIKEAKIKTVQELRTVYRDGELFPLAEVELKNSEIEKKNLADEVDRLKENIANLKKMEDQADELAEIFQKSVEEYHLSSELEASELKLAMANLKLVASEAAMELAKTKGMFKSRQIARIRRNLESAIK